MTCVLPYRFSQVAREVLALLIPSTAHDCFMLACSATQMLYCKQLRCSGWTEENIKRLDDLLWSHAIRCEQFYGLDYCTENLEYSTHMADDIRRHSSQTVIRVRHLKERFEYINNKKIMLKVWRKTLSIESA